MNENLEALVINLKPDHMYMFGLLPNHNCNITLEGSKFFALKRILNTIKPSYKNAKWFKVPKNDICEFIGFKLNEFSNGSYSMKMFYANKIEKKWVKFRKKQ